MPVVDGRLRGHDEKGERMFKWLQTKKLPDEDMFVAGQTAGRTMTDDLDAVINKRLEPAEAAHLAILRSNLQQAIRNEDAPPIFIARISYQVFADEANKLKERVLGELANQTDKWQSTMDEIGLSDMARYYCEQRIEDRIVHLKLAGAKLVNEYGTVIIDTDEIWRQNNPEKSLHFPIDK